MWSCAQIVSGLWLFWRLIPRRSTWSFQAQSTHLFYFNDNEKQQKWEVPYIPYLKKIKACKAFRECARSGHDCAILCMPTDRTELTQTESTAQCTKQSTLYKYTNSRQTESYSLKPVRANLMVDSFLFAFKSFAQSKPVEHKIIWFHLWPGAVGNLSEAVTAILF